MQVNYKEMVSLVVRDLKGPWDSKEYFDFNEHLSGVFHKTKELLREMKKGGCEPQEIRIEKIEASSPSTLKYIGYEIEIGEDAVVEIGRGKRSIFEPGDDTILIGYKGRVDGERVHLQYRIDKNSQFSLYLANSNERSTVDWINVQNVFSTSCGRHVLLIEQLARAADKRIHPSVDVSA